MIVTNFPRAVRVIEHNDTVERRYDAGGSHLVAGGCREKSRPCDPGVSPLSQTRRHVPAGCATHPYLAGHGYAGVRVDLRGSGKSTGLLFDEYATQEQDDGVEVIAWLAAQPWCNGSVGMMGISWGGFNGLQIAACRPPANQGDRHHLLDRRSVRRRRALYGRHVSDAARAAGSLLKREE